MIAHADDALDATDSTTELSDEEQHELIMYGTGEGPPRGIIEANPKAARKSFWKKRVVARLVVTGGGPYSKPLDPRTLGAQILAQMQQNHTAFITLNSRCPCGSGKRFKKCCYAPPE